MMENFIKDDDGLPKRIKDMESLLYTVLCKKDLTQRQFQDHLCTTIFVRSYLEDFKWPTIWLVQI